jgi:Holliday junction resolvasome RuvABC endonuclease subunit
VLKISQFVLNLDQAKNCGWAVYEKNTKKLVNYGVKSFQKYKDYDEAIHELKLFMISLIEQYEPEVVTIEEVHYSRNKNVYHKLSKLQGVLINCLIEREIDFEVIVPSAWKNSLDVAKGNKTKRKEEKENSIKFVENEFGISVDNNTSDAICMGYYYLNKK